MAARPTNLLTAASETNSNSYNTASISPSANKLVLAAIASIHADSAPAIPSLSGASMTWTQIDSILIGGAPRRLSLFRALSASPGSGQITLDFGLQTQVRAHWAFIEIDGIIVSGTNGSGCIVQSVSDYADGTNGGVGLVFSSAFEKSENSTFGAFYKSDNDAITPGSGFTTISQDASTDGGRIFTELRRAGGTGAAVSWTTEAAEGAGIAVELDTIGGGILQASEI